MRGLELNMWEALKKTVHDCADKQTDGRTWRLLDQLDPKGRVGEKEKLQVINENTEELQMRTIPFFKCLNKTYIETGWTQSDG